MKWLKGLDDDNKVFFIDSWVKSGFSGILLDTIGNFDELEDLPHDLNKWTEIMEARAGDFVSVNQIVQLFTMWVVPLSKRVCRIFFPQFI